MGRKVNCFEMGHRPDSPSYSLSWIYRRFSTRFSQDPLKEKQWYCTKESSCLKDACVLIEDTWG